MVARWIGMRCEMPPTPCYAFVFCAWGPRLHTNEPSLQCQYCIFSSFLSMPPSVLFYIMNSLVCQVHRFLIHTADLTVQPATLCAYFCVLSHMLITIFIINVSMRYSMLCAPDSLSPSPAHKLCFVLLYFPLLPSLLFCCSPIYCFLSGLCRIFLRMMRGGRVGSCGERDDWGDLGVDGCIIL